MDDDDDDVSVMDTYMMVMVEATIYVYTRGWIPRQTRKHCPLQHTPPSIDCTLPA